MFTGVGSSSHWPWVFLRMAGFHLIPGIHGEKGDKLCSPLSEILPALPLVLPTPCLKWNGMAGGWHLKPATVVMCA